MENRSINVPREVAEQGTEKAMAKDPREMTAEEWADKWESLTIRDRFIFGKVMSDPNNSLPFLRLLFPTVSYMPYGAARPFGWWI